MENPVSPAEKLHENVEHAKQNLASLKRREKGFSLLSLVSMLGGAVSEAVSDVAEDGGKLQKTAKAGTFVGFVVAIAAGFALMANHFRKKTAEQNLKHAEALEARVTAILPPAPAEQTPAKAWVQDVVARAEEQDHSPSR